ncbi:hypothetical protein Taro_021821 [Colocasia esculenta]|uniref:Uncharacterized protein n=1 Tax=Colocasia esculenta TaxID=4460 RepID=A0A843V9E6_COLES|nr:hypothetical protein [Colocasia esculenta]
MNMNFDVPYEDMVRAARLGSNSGRRLSSGRGSSTTSTYGPSTPPPLEARSSPPIPPTFPTRTIGPSESAPPIFLVGTSTVLEAEDAVSLQEGGGSFYDGTLREESYS